MRRITLPQEAVGIPMDSTVHIIMDFPMAGGGYTRFEGDKRMGDKNFQQALRLLGIVAEKMGVQ